MHTTLMVGDRSAMGLVIEHGFGQAGSAGGVVAREIQHTASLTLPNVAVEPQRLGVYLWSRTATEVQVAAPGVETCFALPADKWAWYELEIAPTSPSVTVHFRTEFGKLLKWAELIVPRFGGVRYVANGEALPGSEKPPHIVVPWTDAAFELYRSDCFDTHFGLKIDPDDPEDWAKHADYRLYFGDIHIHSNRSGCCHPFNGSQEENYRAARDRWGLDFACLTDHEYQTEAQWAESIELANRYNEPGRFATLPGVEWTSLDYGHKNVYFRDDTAPQVSRFDARTDTPERLYAYLKDLDQPALCIPHHPAHSRHLTNWHYHDEEVEPLVELVSNWGNSEAHGASLQSTEEMMPGCYVQDALARGYHLGFTGSSDGHTLMGGDSPIMAAYAPDLSRESIFDAMAARRVYATSGAKIKLYFALNRRFMGSIIKVNQYSIDALFPLRLSVMAEGTANIDRVEVIANGAVIHSCNRHMGRFTRSAFLLEIPNKGANLAQTSRYYYVRVVQTDGHMAWSSPIWIDFEMAERRE